MEITKVIIFIFNLLIFMMSVILCSILISVLHDNVSLIEVMDIIEFFYGLHFALTWGVLESSLLAFSLVLLILLAILIVVFYIWRFITFNFLDKIKGGKSN
ncbi:hypothetical protein [Escherichia coli]|uniref:hypothetical protein n=1 Tax=Escherichia coli TaxID=562 RepID=UPI000BE4BA3B|nr:hypothetical protein [Escherichia coli]